MAAGGGTGDVWEQNWQGPGASLLDGPKVSRGISGLVFPASSSTRIWKYESCEAQIIYQIAVIETKLFVFVSNMYHINVITEL